MAYQGRKTPVPNITKAEKPDEKKMPSVWQQKASSPAALRDLLTSPFATEQISKLANKYMSPDRLLNVSLQIINSPPKSSFKLADCTPASLLQAIINLAEVGLEPGGVRQLAYLIPYNEKGRMLCRPSVSYLGFIELARRSGLLAQVEARVVHEKDKFLLRYGLNQELEHVPYFGKEDPGDPLLVYCIARFKDGGFHVDTMSASEVEKIRQRSFAKDNGPWVTDPEEMWKKTIVRRARKFWPQSEEMEKAGAIDNREDEIEHNIAAPAARPFEVITDRGLEKDLGMKRQPPAPPATAPADFDEPEDADFVNPNTGEVTKVEAPEKMAEPEGDDPISSLLRKAIKAPNTDVLDEVFVEASENRKSMSDAEWADIERAIEQRKSELQ